MGVFMGDILGLLWGIYRFFRVLMEAFATLGSTIGHGPRAYLILRFIDGWCRFL